MPATNRKRPAAPQPLPYPDLEFNEGKKLFWLAAYFRDLSQFAELDQLTHKASIGKKPSEPLLDALIGARCVARDDVAKSIRFVLQNGLLPFAHPTTTIFDSQVVAQ